MYLSGSGTSCHDRSIFHSSCLGCLAMSLVVANHSGSKSRSRSRTKASVIYYEAGAEVDCRLPTDDEDDPWEWHRAIVCAFDGKQYKIRWPEGGWFKTDDGKMLWREGGEMDCAAPEELRPRVTRTKDAGKNIATHRPRKCSRR